MDKKELINLIKETIDGLKEDVNVDFDGSDSDYKGSPDDAAEVESDNLTATLSEQESEEDLKADIKDLVSLIKNPDPSRAKDYGSVENYVKMLKDKLKRLNDKLKESKLKEDVVNSLDKLVALNKIADVQEAELDTDNPFVELVFVTKSPKLKFYIAFDLEEKKFDTIKYDEDINKSIPQLSNQLTKDELKKSYKDVYNASVYDIATIGEEVMKFFHEPEVSEDYKGAPNDAAEVESDELTATLSELKGIIKTAVNEVVLENSILEKIELQSLEDFYQDEMSDVVAESLTNLQEVDLDKYRDMLGANFRELDDDELMNYLKRQYLKRQATTDKELKKQLAKDPEFQRQIKIDRYKYPYIHPSTSVKIIDKSGKQFDLDKLKSVITQRPSKILKQNEKIQHSGGKETIFYNVGLPALKGLAVNEKTGKIVVIDTCPGAGQCQVYCYAKKGGYVQYENAPIATTRLLNFLVNDPAGFKSMLESEIDKAVKSAEKKGANVVIRWHDSGDMFSQDYLNLAYDIARKFPTAQFYAYTKLAGVAQGEKPDNFIMNFSAGAKKPEERQVDLGKTKHSTVVPKQTFDDLIVKDENGKAVRDEKGQIQFSPENLDRLKQKLSVKYGVPKDSILSYEEMKNTPESEEVGKYNVIVRPGDGDESASRKDVKGTYLLIH